VRNKTDDELVKMIEQSYLLNDISDEEDIENTEISNDESDYLIISDHILEDYQVNLLRIIIIGTAGTEKTYLINTIQSRFLEMVRVRFKSPTLVFALTNVTAFNINGIMIYLTLSILIIVDKNLDINSKQLKQLQDRL